MASQSQHNVTLRPDHHGSLLPATPPVYMTKVGLKIYRFMRKHLESMAHAIDVLPFAEYCEMMATISEARRNGDKVSPTLSINAIKMGQALGLSEATRSKMARAAYKVNAVDMSAQASKSGKQKHGAIRVAAAKQAAEKRERKTAARKANVTRLRRVA